MNRSLFDISNQQAQQSYMDLQSLQSIRTQSKDDLDLGLKQVAQQFESIFIQMMLKSMRSVNDVFGQDNPLNTHQTKVYRDMYDNQLSVSLSGKNIGIADALYRQLQKTLAVNSTDSIDVNTVSNTPQRIKDAQAITAIETREDFVSLIKPHAEKIAKEMGVDYRVLVAQSALETGWGKHLIRDKNGNQSFNLFNIKADSRWQGQAVAIPTMEYRQGVMNKEVANFRRYSSIAESFSDYQQFLQQPRYKGALESAADAEKFIQKLHDSGYATDPHYAEKIKRIMRGPIISKVM